MWNPSQTDFDELAKWGLEVDPFAAVKDYSDLKSEIRWLNKENRKVYVGYTKKRLEYISGKNFDAYYKKIEMPIERLRWEYLMKRKAWFIMPLGWDNIANTGGTVVDVGCGDGDTVQRLIDYVDTKWRSEGSTNKELHITGIDLNHSRVRNAEALVKSPSKNITFDFQQGDVVSGLDKGGEQFHYSLITGVLEILEDELNDKFIKEVCRITKRGIYIEDLFEEFPGGHPRNNLDILFQQFGFKQKLRHVILSEPFRLDGMSDPMELWPMLLDQNLWLEKP
jgi:ubiquinone/menaquinone biosynthesis C-methylase UbiE